MPDIVLFTTIAFAAGWLARGLERRAKIRAAREARQRELDDLQGRLALERLRADNLERALSGDPGEAPKQPDIVPPEPRRPYLARPRVATSDSTAARA